MRSHDMKLEMSTYLAGIATAAVAIAAGFGGGILIANSVDTNGAVPAPGMSRIERIKREDQRPATAVETTAQAVHAEEPVINPLAEARPLGANPIADRPTHADEPGIAPATLAAVQSDREPSEIALPAAIQTISAPHHNRTDRRRRLVAERPAAPDEPQVTQPRKRKSGIARRPESKDGEPRDQRESRIADGRALSYDAERRSVFQHIFGN